MIWHSFPLLVFKYLLIIFLWEENLSIRIFMLNHLFTKLLHLEVLKNQSTKTFPYFVFFLIQLFKHLIKSNKNLKRFKYKYLLWKVQKHKGSQWHWGQILIIASLCLLFIERLKYSDNSVNFLISKILEEIVKKIFRIIEKFRIKKQETKTLIWVTQQCEAFESYNNPTI